MPLTRETKGVYEIFVQSTSLVDPLQKTYTVEMTEDQLKEMKETAGRYKGMTWIIKELGSNLQTSFVDTLHSVGRFGCVCDNIPTDSVLSSVRRVA